MASPENWGGPMLWILKDSLAGDDYLLCGDGLFLLSRGFLNTDLP